MMTAVRVAHGRIGLALVGLFTGCNVISGIDDKTFDLVPPATGGADTGGDDGTGAGSTGGSGGTGAAGGAGGEPAGCEDAIEAGPVTFDQTIDADVSMGALPGAIAVTGRIGENPLLEIVRIFDVTTSEPSFVDEGQYLVADDLRFRTQIATGHEQFAYPAPQSDGELQIRFAAGTFAEAGKATAAGNAFAVQAAATPTDDGFLITHADDGGSFSFAHLDAPSWTVGASGAMSPGTVCCCDGRRWVGAARSGTSLVAWQPACDDGTWAFAPYEDGDVLGGSTTSSVGGAPLFAAPHGDGFAVASCDHLALVDTAGVVTATASVGAPAGCAVTSSGEVLRAVTFADGTMTWNALDPDGTLTPLLDWPAAPAERPRVHDVSGGWALTWRESEGTRYVRIGCGPS